MNKKSSLVALGIALVGVLIYVLYSATQSEKSPAVPDKSAAPVSGSPSVSAEQPLLKVHPKSSEPVDPTSDDTVANAAVPPEQQRVPALEPEIREALGKILNTSSEGLVEETHNGVTSIDLQGHFQSAPVATIDKDGNVQITDYSYLPSASAQP